MADDQVEVITSVQRRRRWSRAEKEALVAATLEPGASVSAVPLNRQSATYAREGVDLDVSILADWVGAAAATFDAPRGVDPRLRVRGRAHPCRPYHGAGVGAG